MKSRITIEVDFDNNNSPFLQIQHTDSDDVRDKLISSFLQSLGHTSRWCVINYFNSSNEGLNGIKPTYIWKIIPIKPSDINSEIELMKTIKNEK